MTGLDTLPQTDPTSILRHRDGIYAADILTAAIVEFHLFDSLLAEPTTLGGLCERFGWVERPADVLVTLVKANGFVSEDGNGVLSVTDTAKEHLCSDSPWNLSGYYDSLRDRVVVQDYVKVLQTGKPAHWTGLDEADGDWHDAMMRDEFAKTFTEAMDCRGVFLGKKLADSVQELTTTAKTILDIGGGSGVYACALAANNSELRGIVLEQKPVDEIARRKIEDRGLSDRVVIAVGNMFSDPWPDADLHLFSNVMHDWDRPEIETLLKRSRECLAAGGYVLIHETFLNAGKTGPLPVAEYSCILAHSTQGRCYSVAEMGSFLEFCGFEIVEHRDTGGDRGVIIGRPV